MDNSDHFLVRARFLRKPTRSHKRYLNGRKSFPLHLAQQGPLTTADTMFQQLKAQRDPPDPSTYKVRGQWMSDTTLRLLDARKQHRNLPKYNRNKDRDITNAIRRSLKDDYRNRAVKAADEIGACLDNTADPTKQPDLQGAWDIAKRWYPSC